VQKQERTAMLTEYFLLTAVFCFSLLGAMVAAATRRKSSLRYGFIPVLFFGFFIGGLFIWRKSDKQHMTSNEIEVETSAIYQAVDEEFFSHGQAIVTERRIYQRRNSDNPPQYVVEYVYQDHSGVDFRHSRYLVTQQSDGSYRVEWIPFHSDTQ